MSDPRDAYRTRGGSMTPEELLEKAFEARERSWPGDSMKAVVNVVLEECAKVLKAHAAEIVVLSDGKSHIEYLCLQRNIEAILALKSAPSEAKT